MSIFSEEQEEVRQLIGEENFNTAINLCNEKLQYLINNNIESNNDFWFFNLRLGICYRRLKQNKKAIDYINKSFLYAIIQNETAECWWACASCYYSLGKIKLALELYKKCKDFYERENNENGYYNARYNIAKINNDEKTMQEIVNKLNCTTNNGYLFDNACASLSEMYAKKNQIDSAYNLIHNIRSKSVKANAEKTLAEYRTKYNN